MTTIITIIAIVVATYVVLFVAWKVAKAVGLIDDIQDAE